MRTNPNPEQVSRPQSTLMRKCVSASTAPTRRRGAFALSLPRQHGAWATLGASFLLGAWGLGTPGWELPVLMLLGLSAFFAREALSRSLRLSSHESRRPPLLYWCAIYLGVAAVCLAVLLLVLERWWMIPWTLVAALSVGASLLLERARRDRSALGELAGMAAITLLLPITAYGLQGHHPPQLWGLWLLTLVFFWASTLRVRSQTRNRQDRATTLTRRLRAGRHQLGFLLSVFVLVALFVRQGWAPAGALLVLLPSAAGAIWIVLAAEDRPFSVRRIGFTELGQTVLFVLLALLIYR